MVAFRSFFHTVVLIALTFSVAYVINMALIFRGTPTPWGQYTSLLVTFLAFILAFTLLVIAKKGDKK